MRSPRSFSSTEPPTRPLPIAGGERSTGGGWRWLGALLVVAGLVAGSCAAVEAFGGSPREAVQAFADALTGGDLPAAAATTDAPDAAAAMLAAVRDGLGGARTAATLGTVDGGPDPQFGLTLRWDLGAGRVWSYDTSGRLDRAGGRWQVRWAPSLIHPDLAAGESVELRAVTAEPPRVLDGNGELLMRGQTVTVVRIDPAVGEPAAAIEAVPEALAPLGIGITSADLQRAADEEPGQPFTVVALRDDDLARVQDDLRAVPGVTFTAQSRLLTERGLDSPVLTAQLPEAAAGPGTGWRVVRVDSTGGSAATLAGDTPPVEDLVLTLDRGRQLAAQRAVGTVESPAALVAIRPSTGEVVAVAQNTAADEQGPIALSGLYPPGSTFKAVVAAAVLTAGTAGPDTVLPCPATENVQGRQIDNDEDFDLSTVPLHTAFARSCNTTFARLGVGLPAAGLPDAARRLGLGTDWTVPGMTTLTGEVPEPGSPAEQVEASIGQGRVVASPFGMALVAAGLVTGRSPVPTLIAGRPGVPASAPAPPLAPETVTALAAMMRETVTDGTATRLRSVPGAGGKTGTAQFGDGTRSHGWFIGTTADDLAYAVLAVDAGSSGPAVAIAAEFLAP